MTDHFRDFSTTWRTDDATGEWFEIFNNTNQTINIVDPRWLTVNSLILTSTHCTVSPSIQTLKWPFALLFGSNIDTDGDGVYDGPTGIQPDFVYDYPVMTTALTVGGFI